MSELQTDPNTSGNPFMNFNTEVNDRPSAFYGVGSHIHSYQRFVPKAIGNQPTELGNPLALRKLLLENDDFLNDTVANMFLEARTDEGERFYRDNPDEYQKDFQSVKNEVYNNLSSEVLSGEDIENAIKKRQKQLTEVQVGDLGIDTIKSIVNNNTDIYEDFGVTINGEIDLNNQSLQRYYNTNEAFKDRLLEDHYKMFVDDLSKSHNKTGIDTYDVDQMGIAYAVYREFGKEGLTQIINYNQHYDSSKPEEEQDQRAKEAIDFIKKANHDGKSVSGVLEEFFGSEESEYGKFTYTPSQESLEMSMKFPIDFNRFTAKTKYDANFNSNKERAVNFVKEYRSEAAPVSFQNLALSLVSKVLGDVSTFENLPSTHVFTAVADEQTKNVLQSAFYTEESGEQTKYLPSFWSMIKRSYNSVVGNENEDKYFEAEEQVIADSYRDGTLSHYERNLAIDTHREATRSDGDYSMMDLLSTAVLNSKMQLDEEGQPRYIVDLSTADFSTNLAVRALRISDKSFVKNYGDSSDQFIIDPRYLERLNNSKMRHFYDQLNEKQVPHFDGDGNFIGTTVKPASSFLGWIGTGAKTNVNLINGFADHFLQVFNDYIMNPIYDMATEYTRDTSLEPFVARQRASHDDRLGYYLDMDGVLEQEGFLENASYGAGHLLGYITTSYKIGQSTLNRLAQIKAFETVKDIKNARTVEEALNFIKPATGGRLRQIAHSTGLASKDISGVSRGAGLWANLEVGEVVRQPFTPASFSLYQAGEMTDQLGLTTEGADYKDAYIRSNRIGQIGADILANGALSMAFDNIFAATRFGANKLGMLLGVKKGGNSWRIQKTVDSNGNITNNYKFLKGSDYNLTEGYSPDIRRFIGLAMKEMETLPDGIMTETVKKFTQTPAFAIRQPETINDIAFLFKEDADEFIGNLYADVRNTLEHFDSRLGGTQQPKHLLDARARKITKDATNHLGSQLGEALLESGDETLALRVASALRSVPSTDEFIPHTAPDGSKSYNMSIEEAQRIQNNVPFSAIVDSGEGIYRVVKRNTSFWTEELANKIEETAILPSRTKIFERFLKSKNIDPTSTKPKDLEAASEAEEIFNKYYGKGVNVDGAQGVIVDIVGDDLIVQSRPKFVKTGEGDRIAPEAPREVTITGDNVNVIETDGATRRVKIDDNLQFFEPSQEELRQARDVHRKTMAQEARKKRLKKTDRERWFEQYQKENEQYQKYLKKIEDEKLKVKRRRLIEYLNKKDSIFAKYGVTKKYNDFIKAASNYKQTGKAITRKWVSLLGHNGVLDFDKIGVNKKGVEYLDLAKVKEQGGLPKNVVFKRNVNGKEEHFITIRKTPDEFNPNVWMISEDSGMPILNPYIRRIDRNATWTDENIVLYKPVEVKIDGEKITMYRPATKREKGYVLNIQKPIKDDGHVNFENIHDQGIDGLMYNLGDQTLYRPIDEINQVVDLAHLKDHRYADSNNIITKPSPPMTEEQLEQFVSEIAGNTKLMENLMKTNVMAGGIVGLMADTIAYNLGDDSNFSFKFSILGMALQSGPKLFFRNYSIGGVFKKGAQSLWDRTLKPKVDAERAKKLKDKILDDNHIDKFDEADVQKRVLGVEEVFALAKQGRIGITEAVMGSKYARSMFSELEKLNSPTAKKMQQILMNLTRTTGEIYSEAATRFNNNIYEQRIATAMKENNMTRAQAEEIVEPINNYWETMVEEVGPARTREILDEVMGVDESRSDKYVKRTFNALFNAIIESGAKFPEQLLPGAKKIENKSVLDLFNTPGMGENYQKMAKRLFDDPEVQAMVRSEREAKLSVETRYLNGLGEIVTDLIEHPKYGLRKGKGDELADMAHDYINSGKNSQRFLRELKEDQTIGSIERQKKVNAFTNLMDDRNHWDDLEDVALKLRKYKSFKGEYVLQKESDDAILREREKFILREGLETETKSRKDELWEDYKVWRYIEVNADRDKLAQLKEINKDTGEMSTKTFKSQREVERKLEQLEGEFRTRGWDDKIDKLRNGHSVEEIIIYSRKGKPSKEYVLSLPDEVAYGVKGDIRGANSHLLKEYYALHQQKLNAPRSNYLDNARTAYVPYEFRELDIESLRHIYSRDTGRRLHNIENGMYNKKQLEGKWIDNIREEIRVNNPDMGYEDINPYINRVRDIYNVANGLLGESEAELKQIRQRNFASGIIRNLQFWRFGYGFGAYNLFEWATVGSQISGGFGNMLKTLANQGFNATSTNNLEALLSNELIFKKQIQFARPEFNQMGIYDYGMTDVLAKSNYYSAVGANAVGNFSVMGSVLGMDMRKFGAFRLLPVVGDSFLGSSMYASAMVARATLGEVADIARAARKMNETPFEEGAPRIVKHNGKSYTPGEIERRLELYGVLKEDQQDFIEGSLKFEELIGKLDNDPHFHQKMAQLKYGDDAPKFGKYMDQVVNITRTAVESYNGINKLSRPSTWHSPSGQVVSMYSTYAFNVSLQTLQKRIKQPLEQYFQKHDGTRTSKLLSAAEIVFNIKNNNYDYLMKNGGMTKEAIEEFPVEAVTNILRVFGSIGITVAGYMSLATIRDFASIMASDITGSDKELSNFDDWTALRRELTLNPFAAEKDQVTFGDLIEEGLNPRIFAQLAQHGLTQAGRLGTFGQYANLTNPGGLYGGLAGMTPVTSEVQKALGMANGFYNDPINFMTDTAPSTVKKRFWDYVPFLGSNLFSEGRRDWRENVDKDKKRTKTKNSMYRVESGITKSLYRIE